MVLIQSWSRAVRCSLEKDEPIELTLGDVLLNTFSTTREVWSPAEGGLFLGISGGPMATTPIHQLQLN
jgi:hypothetical protein